MNIINFHPDESGYITTYQLGQWGRKISDIRYSSRSERNVMDLYIPNTAGSHPVIFFLHSGGFFRGDKTRHLSLMLQGLARGYALCAMNYRLTNETNLEGIYDDAVCALHFFKRHAAKYHLDPDNIIACGETHGVHIMCNLMLAAGTRELEERDPDNDGTDCHLNGIIMYYPVNRFAQVMDIEDKQQKDIPADQRIYIETAMFNDYGASLRGKAEKECIQTWLASEDTHVLIVHAAEDHFFPHAWSEELTSAFQKNHADVTLFSPSGIRHGWGKDAFVDEENAQQILAFMQKHFAEK